MRDRTGSRSSPETCRNHENEPIRSNREWSRVNGCTAPGIGKLLGRHGGERQDAAHRGTNIIAGDAIMKACESKYSKLQPEAHLPEYAHGPEEDAGMDLRATAGAVLEPGIPQAIPTGLAIEVPPGYEAQLRPRSGLALKHAITLPNAPATIDPGYRGEIKVILLNLGRQPYEIHAGDRIAQMVIARYEAVEWIRSRAR